MKLSVAAALLAAFSLSLAAGAAPPAPVTESLPGPVVNSLSFELLSNSRVSVHSGFTDTLSRQVLANVLWAMGRVPHLSTGDRDFYVATRDNVYRYDPADNTLAVHRAGDMRYSPGSAFEIGIAAERDEEVGMYVQVGVLAGSAFNAAAGPGVVSCPMKWASDHANDDWDPDQEIRMVNVFGAAECDEPDTLLAAVSSDSTLPPPNPVGSDTFEIVLMDLGRDSVFSPVPLSFETVSQLLWAAYGATPHEAINGKLGLTVPSASMGYYLTGTIYLASGDGVDRYWSRAPGGSHYTADHRLEEVTPSDRRVQLRAAAASIPSTAPVYVVLAVTDTSSYRSMQEAGFAAFQLLAQARAMGLSGYVAPPLTIPERADVAAALGLPAGQFPVLVFAGGELATGIAGPEVPPVVEITRARPVVRLGDMFRVEYLLRHPATVRAEVFDLLGRPVYRIFEERQTAGYHSVEWDCADDDADLVKKGSYVIGIFASGSSAAPSAVAQHKVTVF